MATDSRLSSIVSSLSGVSPLEEEMNLHPSLPRPSVERLGRLMGILRRVLFPGFFDEVAGRGLEDDIAEADSILREQIERGLSLEGKDRSAEEIALAFLGSLPSIREALLTDAQAALLNDPAARNIGEVIFCYPVIKVMTNYRTAHRLWELGVPLIPRIITEMAHSETGIDIHPGASIGRYFGIDHGTGIVIGQTAVIGDHCMIYQGVTLGARNFQHDAGGRAIDIPRHPIIEDNVTIYSNASVLGRIRIGHDSIIGGNLWISYDVPPHSRVLQNRLAAYATFEDGGGI